LPRVQAVVMDGEEERPKLSPARRPRLEAERPSSNGPGEFEQMLKAIQPWSRNASGLKTHSGVVTRGNRGVVEVGDGELWGGFHQLQPAIVDSLAPV